MTPRLTFRPHHFLCVLGFQGMGYSDRFTANMAALVDQLRGPDGDAVEIEVTFQADHICAPCPHRCGTGCDKAAQISALDRSHAQALGLQDGARLTWGAAQKRIVAHVQNGDLAQICAGCRWLELGLCESGLRELHRQRA